MRMPDIKYVIASTIVLLLLTSCGTLNSFSSSDTGQNAKSRTIKKNTSSCPCLYAVIGNKAVTALARASGKWVQIRQIAGSNTELLRPTDFAEDAGGSLYVVNYHYRAPSITVYAPGASGNVTPIQKIKGPATGLEGPSGIAFDQNTNEIYVANANNSITIYPAAAAGNAAPIGVISGPATGLSGPNGITLDTGGNIYVTNDTNSITVYAPGSSGNVAPTRTIAGSRTKLAGPRELAVDSSGNIYVGKIRNNPTYILVFGAGMNGNVAPIRKIHGHLTNLRHPEAVAVDGSDKVYVGGKGEPVNIYAAGSNGNVAPIDTAPVGLHRCCPSAIRILPL